jgi:hypothetical protein
LKDIENKGIKEDAIVRLPAKADNTKPIHMALVEQQTRTTEKGYESFMRPKIEKLQEGAWEQMQVAAKMAGISDITKPTVSYPPTTPSTINSAALSDD